MPIAGARLAGSRRSARAATERGRPRRARPGPTAAASWRRRRRSGSSSRAPRPVPGTRVRAGDRLGYVDVLGVRQEVVAPVDGVVGRELVEAGDAVEYGQELIVIELATRGRGRGRLSRCSARSSSPTAARSPCASCAPAGRWASRRSSPTARPTATRCAVQLADEAICIGPADAKRSYLSAPAILSAALVTGCDAIHPGYGFLSEDEALRRGVARPRPDVHRAAARGPRAVRHQGGHAPAARRRTACPTIPGSDGMLRDDDARARRGRAHRLPGAHQAVGGRRRQGHAHGPHAARARAGPQGLPLGGEGRLRRRLALPREVARGEPPRRGPGRRRPLRPRRPPRRARLLRPAAPPEDPRGGADARPSSERPARTSPSAPSRPSSRPATRTSGTLEFLVDRDGHASTSSRSTAGSRWSTR